MSKFKLGDPVILVSTIFRPSRVHHTKIGKVGRKYVYVEGRHEKYDPETGREVSEYSYHSTLYTPEGYALSKRREEAFATLRRWGVTLDHTKHAHVLAVHEALKSVFEPPASCDDPSDAARSEGNAASQAPTRA